MTPRRTTGTSSLTVGHFDMDLPQGWGEVTDQRRPGVVVLDPLAAVPGVPTGQAAVVIRTVTEDSGGGVAAASLRAAAREHAGRVRSILLDYHHGVTNAGLPLRRQSWALRLGPSVLHLLRWHVGAGAEILEVLLTVEEHLAFGDLTQQADQLVVSARAPAIKAPPEEDLPVAHRERSPAGIRAVDAPRLTVTESLDGVHEGTAVAVRMAWTEPDAETTQHLRSAAPLLQAMGTRDGRPTVCTVHVDGQEAALVRST